MFLAVKISSLFEKKLKVRWSPKLKPQYHIQQLGGEGGVVWLYFFLSSFTSFSHHLKEEDGENVVRTFCLVC